MATSYTMELYRGDDASWDVTVVDTATELPINLTDMTGRKFWFTVKQQLTDGDSLILFQKTSAGGGGIAIQNAIGGIIRISVLEADTERFMAPMTFQYDIRFKNSDNKVTTIVIGQFRILGNVTRELV